MVEGTGLENRHTCKGIESSNLSLSVSSEGPEVARAFLLVGILERCWDGWPSGLRRTPGKCVYVNSVPWVRIPPRPSEHKIRSTVSENYDRSASKPVTGFRFRASDWWHEQFAFRCILAHCVT